MINKFIKYFTIGFASLLILVFFTSFVLTKSSDKEFVEKIINIDHIQTSKPEVSNNNEKTLGHVRKNMSNVIPEIIFIVFTIAIFLGLGHQIGVRLGLIKNEDKKNED